MSDEEIGSIGSPLTEQRSKIRRALLGALVAAAASVLIFSLLGDVREIGAAVRGFDWRFVPVIVLLTIWNYIWRSVKFRRYLAALGVPVAQGRFGAEMAVELVNDGPVTIWLDSDDLQRPRNG